MEAILGGGGVVGLLLLWKLVEKIVDAKLGKRNNKGSNPGKPILCPYDNSVALKNSLNNIDVTLGDLDKTMSAARGSLERIERKLGV